MKNDKKKYLLKAIVSRDKKMLREALSYALPDLWMTVEIDHNESTIRYQGKLVTEQELKDLIEEASMLNKVRLIIMNHDRKGEGQELDEIWTICGPEIIIDILDSNVANRHS